MLYDANTRRLVFEVNIGKDIEQGLKDQAKKQVATIIGNGKPEDVELLALEFEAYEVYLTQGSKRVLVQSGQPGEGPYAPRLFVNALIQYPAFHEALVNDRSSLSITFRPFTGSRSLTFRKQQQRFARRSHLRPLRRYWGKSHQVLY